MDSGYLAAGRNHRVNDVLEELFLRVAFADGFPGNVLEQDGDLECGVSAPLFIAVELLSLDQLPLVLRDQPGSDLELPSKQMGWAVGLQRRDGCFANQCSR